MPAPAGLLPVCLCVQHATEIMVWVSGSRDPFAMLCGLVLPVPLWIRGSSHGIHPMTLISGSVTSRCYGFTVALMLVWALGPYHCPL